jgi:hypothetical protein
MSASLLKMRHGIPEQTSRSHSSQMHGPETVFKPGVLGRRIHELFKRQLADPPQPLDDPVINEPQVFPVHPDKTVQGIANSLFSLCFFQPARASSRLFASMMCC